MNNKKTDENKYCILDIEKSSKIAPSEEKSVSAIEKKINLHIVNPNTDDIIIIDQNFNRQPSDYKGLIIPEVSQITSSPDIVLGPDTLSMVDEFIKEESRIEENKKKGILGRILSFVNCCK